MKENRRNMNEFKDIFPPGKENTTFEKNKNFTFKTIDVGKRCRLNAGKTVSISEET